MPSVFAWLDHSEEQRRKVLDVIDMFKEKGTVDELGLGTVRDAVADILFPGTSNLMTRAAYYLFVPWTYQRLESQKVSSSDIASRARREELRLIERLLESGEKVGVIGRFARTNLIRLPSSVYWSGMKRLGICLFDGSPDSYHRSLDRYYQRRRVAVRTDDNERIGGGRENWNPRLPAAPDGWPAKAQLALSRDQAEFLRDQIALTAPASLLALLVRQKDAPKDVEFPWAHPSRLTFPAKINRELRHAQNLSEVMHGAPLLYNLMLSEVTSNPELEQHYRSWMGEWANSLKSRIGQLREWDRRDTWDCVESEGARLPPPTREFVDRWCELVLAGDPQKVVDDERARLLVRNRERRLKGVLARLENKRAQELWQGAAGVGQLDFRWSNAAVLVEDVVTSLHGRQDA
jgi:hypothetical protein